MRTTIGCHHELCVGKNNERRSLCVLNERLEAPGRRFETERDTQRTVCKLRGFDTVDGIVRETEWDRDLGWQKTSKIRRRIEWRYFWFIADLLRSGVFRNMKRGPRSGGPSMEGPKVTSEARRREAPERRGGWGLGRVAVAPPQYGCLGAMPPGKFSKDQRWNSVFWVIFASWNGLFCLVGKAALDNRHSEMVRQLVGVVESEYVHVRPVHELVR